MESSLTTGDSVEAFLATNPLFYSLNPAVLASIAERLKSNPMSQVKISSSKGRSVTASF